MKINEQFKAKYTEHVPEEMSIEEYLQLCVKDKSVYANAAERMLKAIGEPRRVVTANSPQLSRIFANRVIDVYETFEDFYGMEDVIIQLVSYFKHAAQGLEEKKQILYLLGPVGGGKSSLAERLKFLMTTEPIYVLKGSPIQESPLGLFSGELAQKVAKEYGIPERYLKSIPSPWAVKRLKESGGDLSTFRVVKIYPDQLTQTAVAKTEPGDENTQDISTLVGKTNIRMLERYNQDDTDSYSYSGGLCYANRGLLDFVEMFKAPIKMLHPLLTATQEGNYSPSESVGAIPFDGIVLAHSNESEWSKFKADKNNEAFLDRIYIVKVPYCLRYQQEEQIYKKMLDGSSLKDVPCAPDTLKLLAQFAVMSRFSDMKLQLDNNDRSIYTKLRVYNGENMKDKDQNAKPLKEYKELAALDEGMYGVSTRDAFKLLAKVFNYDTDEIAANPVHLFYHLKQYIDTSDLPEESQINYNMILTNYLITNYYRFLEREIKSSIIDSHSEYGQNVFDRYVTFADFWVQDQDYRDPDTGEMYDRASLNEWLESIEKPAKISNPKDFRHDVVNFVLRAKANSGGEPVRWDCYEKLKTVIEDKMFAHMDDLLPVISVSQGASDADKRKQKKYLERMKEKGYTAKQVRILGEWYSQVRKTIG